MRLACYWKCTRLTIENNFHCQFKRSWMLIHWKTHFWVQLYHSRESYGPWTLIPITCICSFRFFFLLFFAGLHLLKWILVHRFIIIISWSSSILGMIELFTTELCTFDFEKLHLFAADVEGVGHKYFTNISCCYRFAEDVNFSPALGVLVSLSSMMHHSTFEKNSPMAIMACSFLKK